LYATQNKQFIVLLGSEKVGFDCHKTIEKALRLTAIGEHFGKAW